MRTTLAVFSMLAIGGAAAEAADADHGRTLFLRDGCYQCHGTVGQGGAAGPRIAPAPMPAVVIIHYIRHPTGQMPPFSDKVVSDAEVEDIRAYLAGVPPPPPVASLPQFAGTPK